MVLCRVSDPVELVCFFLLTLPTKLAGRDCGTFLSISFWSCSVTGSVLSSQMHTPFTQLHISTDKLSTHLVILLIPDTWVKITCNVEQVVKVYQSCHSLPQFVIHYVSFLAEGSKLIRSGGSNFSNSLKGIV